MQRAASTPNRAVTISSPFSANISQHVNRHSATRQKFSASDPQTPDLNASSPYPSYHSDDPGTPLSPRSSNRGFTPVITYGNDAETPWVLDILGSFQHQVSSTSQPEDISPENPIIGRRTFGNFKKKTMQKVTPVKNGENDSFSSELSGEEGGRNGGKKDKNILQNGESMRGKRRQDRYDDQNDKISLKKLKTTGISASSSMRQPAFMGSKYKKDKRKA